jgi:hypothetical protein|tara:strand:+ start:144 stop:989 length:846 start_codon:yes stop_codon:yes gene_type:complete
MATTDLYFVSGALAPTKRGMRFLGGNVDDGVQVDAGAAAMVAGNHTTGTFMCDFMVPDATGTYTLWGAGDANAVEYVHITVEEGTIWVMMVKAGPTTQIDVNTAEDSIKAHKHYNLAVVQDGNVMKIYLNGKDMPLTWTTSTERGQWFADLNNIDGAHIGAADSVAGAAALTQEFKGYIANVRMWSDTAASAALDEDEVNQAMSGASVAESDLLNSWNLDQNVFDEGTGEDDGTVVGALIYSDFNEFASRLTFLETTPLAADNVHITSHDGIGYAYSILGA